MKNKLFLAVFTFFVSTLSISQSFSTFSFTSSNMSDGPSQWGNYGCYANGSLINSNCLATGLPAYFTGSYPMFQCLTSSSSVQTSVLDFSHSTGTGKFLTYSQVLSNATAFQKINIYFSSSLKAYFGGLDILNKSGDGLTKTFTIRAYVGSTIVGTTTANIPYNIVTNVSTVNVSGFTSVDRVEILAPSDINYFGVNNFLLKGQSTLPVELTTFNANCTENGNAISWQTASEHNSAYFEVEKSRDGANWSVVETVAGAGNSNEIINYSIIDEEKASTIVYYRLNQVDQDGISKIYGPISAACNADIDFNAHVFPNPTSGAVTLVLNTSMPQTIAVQVIGTDGKIYSQATSNIAAGSTLLPLEIADLKAGIYSVNIQGESTIQTVKVVVL